MELFYIIVGGFIVISLYDIYTQLKRISEALEYSNKLKYDEWMDDYRQTVMNRVNRK